MRDPQTLTHEVATAIQNTPYLSGRTLRFEEHDGHVVLRGIVGSYFQKQMAQEAIRRIRGVLRIRNELEVLSPALPTA